MKQFLIKSVVYTLSPVLYLLTERQNGKSVKDFIEFVKGN